MKTTRKRYSGDFKAKVALEAIPGDLTLADGSQAWCPPHYDRILEASGHRWDGWHVFRAAKAASESEMEKLHAKIGQLVVERDFLAKAFGR